MQHVAQSEYRGMTFLFEPPIPVLTNDTPLHIGVVAAFGSRGIDADPNITAIFAESFIVVLDELDDMLVYTALRSILRGTEHTVTVQQDTRGVVPPGWQRQPNG
jgi:hypothetical protein